MLPHLDRITFNRHIMGGQACIRGMRIPVLLILNLVAQGEQTADILTEYPDLEAEDIRQALEYAAWLSREQVPNVLITVNDDSIRVRQLPIRRD